MREAHQNDIERIRELEQELKSMRNDCIALP